MGNKCRRGILALTLSGMAALTWAGGKKPARPAQNPGIQVVTVAPVAAGQQPVVTSVPVENVALSIPSPVFLAELPNPNDFILFANGAGWDGNWYVGYNTCWISKLPPAPPGPYAKAFLGARLGRMKTESVPGRPSWEKQPINGVIDISVASEPLWPQSKRFLLTPTADIPLEGDLENAVEGVGESRWFWVEVPPSLISSSTNNYVALFSPSDNLKDAAHSPILASGWGTTLVNTWLNSSVKGGPPVSAEEALRTGVTYFEPGIAIKLIPPNDGAVSVALTRAPAMEETVGETFLIGATVLGQDVESAWVEFSTNTKHWHRAAPPAWTPPYLFSIKSRRLVTGLNHLRVIAMDAWHNRGQSAVISVNVPPPAPPSQSQKKK
jgi:hypothetical protein